MLQHALYRTGFLWSWIVYFFVIRPMIVTFGAKYSGAKYLLRLIIGVPIVIGIIAWAPVTLVTGSLLAAIHVPKLLFITIPLGGFFTFAEIGAMLYFEKIEKESSS